MCQNRMLITKYGSPFAPKTKYGTAYVPRSYTHLLRNLEPLLPLLINMEQLMCQDHTPIHYEIWNPSYDTIAKRGNPYIATFCYKITNPLSVNFYFTKIGNPYFQTIT